MKPSLPRLFWAFARYGNLTFGGGTATIATLHEEVVERKNWIGQESFDLAYALSRLTPGTNLLAFCTAIGWRLRSWPGAISTLVAASVPCGVMAVMLTICFSWWSKNPTAQIALKGALVAAVAVMAITGITIIRPHWRGTSRFQLLLFVAGAFIASFWLGITPIRVLVVAAVAGLLWPVGGRKA